MHGEEHRSNGPRLAMTGAHVAGVAVAAFFLARDGLTARDTLLLACGLVYLGRLLLTSFYTLRRAVGWAEAAQVGPFLLLVQAALGFLGSRALAPLRAIDWAAVVLYVVGSYLNTASEWQRKRWKTRPENKGRLYTEGLFALSMHVNYFGDTVLFTGFALLTTSPWALLVPAVMTVGFVFLHIPMLDRYLATRYGEAFEAWARRTKKFVPFVY